MPSSLSGLWRTLLTGWLLLTWAAIAAAATGTPRIAPAVALQDEQMRADAQAMGEVWFDAEGKATLEQVVQGSARSQFMPGQPDEIRSLGDQGNLWMHWRLVRSHNTENGWVMIFPMPALDSVTLYQQNARGQWVAQSAGDTIAVARWPEPGRYPHFRLELPLGQPRDIYARIHHLTPANFPVRILTEAAYDERIQLEYLGLGTTFGALLLLIIACIAQALVYRDGAYAWYAGYALATTLCVSAFTGAAAHLLWPGFGALADAPQAMLALLAGAAAILFVRNLIGIAGRHHLIDRMVLGVGVAGFVLTGAFPLFPKSPGLALVGIYITASTLISMWIALDAWRRSDPVGAWVLASYVPLTIAVLLAVARMAGWLPVTFATQYSVVVAMAIEVPLLLVALSIRSRDRHGAQIRELALSTQDALTGLLAAHLFNDRLRQVVTRHRHHPENAAVAFIDLVNYPAIKAQFGTAAAEQSLLRSVIKLRRLLRDVDTVSRVGEARFGLILEGAASRTVVTDRAARLIAAGLMPLKGLKPEVTLQFHIAAVMLQERTGEAHALVDALDGLLASMSPRTRRPIRFLEVESTQPAGMDDSALTNADSGPAPAEPAGAASASIVPLSRSASSP